MPKSKRKSRHTPSQESRSVDTLTIAWSLTVMTTLVCMLLGGAVGAAFRWYYPEAISMGMFASIMMFAATVLGMIAVLLTPVVIRSRRVPPPRSIVVTALVISLAPLVAIMISQLYYAR